MHYNGAPMSGAAEPPTAGAPMANPPLWGGPMASEPMMGDPMMGEMARGMGGAIPYTPGIGYEPPLPPPTTAYSADEYRMLMDRRSEMLRKSHQRRKEAMARQFQQQKRWMEEQYERMQMWQEAQFAEMQATIDAYRKRHAEMLAEQTAATSDVGK